MNKVNLIILCIVLLSACAKKTVVQNSQQPNNGRPSSLNPENNNASAYGKAPAGKDDRFLFIFKRKQKVGWGDQLVLEYRERMKQNAKDAKKKAKEMEKPQYSDPSYFGHKRKPKKRAPDKMKYCEECGIRH